MIYICHETHVLWQRGNCTSDLSREKRAHTAHTERVALTESGSRSGVDALRDIRQHAAVSHDGGDERDVKLIEEGLVQGRLSHD